MLEDRRLLAVVWINRGTAATDTDSFGATYGANAAIARQIVDRAVQDWSAVITDFNYDGDNDPATDNIYQLTVNAADLGGGSRGVANTTNIDGNGLPTAATITMDDDGGGGGWFFDPTPYDDDEFTTVVNAFQAESGGNPNDFYRTIVHEIGHAMGIGSNGSLALAGFLTTAGTDQIDNASDLNTFQNLAGQYGVLATLTDNGGRHIYEGPVDPGFPGAPTHPNDLMNPGRTVNPPPTTRQLISDLNAQILADAYGYQVTLPSQLSVFIAPDRVESNNTLATATALGSLDKVTLRGLSIFDQGDRDFFQITAAHTGKLIINALFIDGTRAANPPDPAIFNDLHLRLYDATGAVIASSTSTTDNEQIIVPVVTQETYYIEVYGATVNDINRYDLEVENFPAPVPSGVYLDPSSDTGWSNADHVTSNQQPRFLVLADLTELETMFNANPNPSPAGVIDSNGAAGADVTLQLIGLNTATVVNVNASRVGSTNLWTATPAAPLPDDFYSVAAAVTITDLHTSAVTGRTKLSAPVWVRIDSTAPIAAAPDMLASSDSGISDTDNVTNIQSPAFGGTTEPNARVRVLANGRIVGQGTATADGRWEITVEPLVDGVYNITTEVEDAAGNIGEFPGESQDPLQIEIDTLSPNLPLLDLAEADDTGRHNDDNVTNITLVRNPEFSMTTEDRTARPGVFAHLFQQNLQFRVFDRLEGGTEVLIYDSVGDASIAGKVDGLTELEFLARRLSQILNNPNGAALADGIHNLKLEAEDRAGNISFDFTLDVLIDTVAPPVSIGLPGNAIDGIDPAKTDTGVQGHPDTFIDRITSDTRTGFWGRAEANSIVRLYVDDVPGDGITNPGEYSLTVAEPLDGDEAFPNGQWRTHFVRHLNDPNWFLHDGLREVLVTAEDLAGNVNAVSDQLGDADQSFNVFVDTQGPQITAVEVNNQGNPYDLFDPKPSTDGPTPPVSSLVISVRDLPNRITEFLYDALQAPGSLPAESPGHFQVIGDHNGMIPIYSVTFTTSPALSDGNPAEGYITLDFDNPATAWVETLPDDRFTLIVRDTLVDPAGNALDGESNAAQPLGAPSFPSGDGQPGGDFIARFSVDTRAEIGVWSGGSVYVDSNGNFVWDPEGKDNDKWNRDVTYVMGFSTDNVFAGNFAALTDDPATPEDETVADGFHKIAGYGRIGKDYRWLIDTNNDGVPDLVLTNPLKANGYPAAGDFDGDAANGDEVVLKVGKTWYVDGFNGGTRNLTVEANEKLPGSMDGYPVVGDFDDDGYEDLGTWRDDFFALDLSSLRADPTKPTGSENFRFSFAMNTAFTGVREIPVAADFDGDGIDDLGLWVPRHAGATPGSVGEWYVLISRERPITDRVRPNPQGGGQIVDFVPFPFGADVFGEFGSDFSMPVVGNFDPHDIQVPLGGFSWANIDWGDHRDVNGDGFVSAIDALNVINAVNLHGIVEIVHDGTMDPYVDVNGDGILSASDVLEVIAHLNSLSAQSNDETTDSDPPVDDLQSVVNETEDPGDLADPTLDEEEVDDFFASEEDGLEDIEDLAAAAAGADGEADDFLGLDRLFSLIG